MDVSRGTARVFNALTAPSDIVAGDAPKWQARDDVYQVGQLLAMLIKRLRAKGHKITLLTAGFFAGRSRSC